MAKPEKLTVAEALAQAQMIDSTLAAWDETAPEFVASVGGRDALARRSEMTCVGPVPRLEVEEWQRASIEWWERWQAERGGHYAAAPRQHAPGPAAHPAAEPTPSPRRRGFLGLFGV